VSSGELDQLEIGKRIAVESELESLDEAMQLCKGEFDETGNFLVSRGVLLKKRLNDRRLQIFGSIVGIKLLNIVTNKVSRVLGSRDSSERFLGVALYQVQQYQTFHRQC
jgi:peptidylprolyl isomerase domain and WD repeat-containing protein 1